MRFRNAFHLGDSGDEIALVIIGIIPVAERSRACCSFYAGREGPRPTFVGSDPNRALDPSGRLLLREGGLKQKRVRGGARPEEGRDLANVTA